MGFLSRIWNPEPGKNIDEKKTVDENLSAMIAILNRQTPNRNKFREAFDQVFDNSVVLDSSAMMATTFYMAERCTREDIFQYFWDVARANLQAEISEIKRLGPGVISFEIRYKSESDDELTVRERAYLERNKITRLELKEVKSTADTVIRNLESLFAHFGRKETDIKRRFRAVFDKRLVLATITGEIPYNRMLQYFLDWNSDPNIQVRLVTVQRYLLVGLEYKFSVQSPEFGPNVSAIVHCIAQVKKRKIYSIQPLRNAKLCRMVFPYGGAYGHADSVHEESLVSGQCCAAEDSESDFFPSEAELAKEVQPLPEEMKGQIMGNGTTIVPVEKSGHVVKVCIVRHSTTRLFQRDRRMALELPFDNEPFANGAYIMDNRFNGKFVLCEESGKPIAVCTKNDGKSFYIRGRRPLIPGDLKKSTVRGIDTFPWFCVRSIDKRMDISIYNGKAYECVWVANISKGKVSRKSFIHQMRSEIIIKSLSSKAPLCFMLRKQGSGGGWTLTIAPGVDPVAMLCVAACLEGLPQAFL